MELTLPLDQMTTSDKLRALEEIWQDLCRTPESIPAPPWHSDVLHAREKRLQEGSAKFVDWADAKQNIREAVK
ncbi:addiction module protein [Myxococcota bacterium]|nr:addiction module protein [Myxococcota bacterium]